MKSISELSELVTNSPIREMFNRSLGMKDVVSFTVGEPDFTTPENIVNAAIDALRRGEHHYTPNAGILPLREAIERHVRKTHGMDYDPNTQIMATAGGMEALYLCMLSVLNPGDEVILSDPCWTNYSRQVLLCHAVPKFIRVDESTNFQMDPSVLEKLISSKTKLVVINSPANPTGGVADAGQLEEIAKILIKHDLYVISDEVYSSLYYGEGSVRSIATFPSMRERTIIVNSFSKTYAMTGWRVGYALGPEQIIKTMVKFQENVAACVNTATQFAAIEALEGDQSGYEHMLEVYRKRREIVISGFSKIKGVKLFAPQGAFYAFLDISASGLGAKEFAFKLLERQRVIVVPGYAFGEGSDSFVRLSFATSEETVREGIRRIGLFMEEINGRP